MGQTERIVRRYLTRFEESEDRKEKLAFQKRGSASFQCIGIRRKVPPGATSATVDNMYGMDTFMNFLGHARSVCKCAVTVFISCLVSIGLPP